MLTSLLTHIADCNMLIAICDDIGRKASLPAPGRGNPSRLEPRDVPGRGFPRDDRRAGAVDQSGVSVADRRRAQATPDAHEPDAALPFLQGASRLPRQRPRRLSHGVDVRCPWTGGPARSVADPRSREVLARRRGTPRAAGNRQASALARLSRSPGRNPRNAESRGAPASGLSTRQSGSAPDPAGGGDTMTPQQFYLVCFAIGFVLSILGAF